MDKETLKQQQRDVILEILSETGWKPTNLAERAGVSASTVNRFMKGSADNALSATTMQKILIAAGREDDTGLDRAVFTATIAFCLENVWTNEQVRERFSNDDLADLILMLYRRTINESEEVRERLRRGLLANEIERKAN